VKQRFHIAFLVFVFGLFAANASFSQDTASSDGASKAPPPAGLASTFFGMDINANNSTDPWPSTVSTISFGTYRTLGSSGNTKWADVYNCSTNTYTWTNFDTWMSLASTNGQEVMVTAYYTPECLTAYTGTNADTSCAFASEPSGCDLPSDLNSDGTGTDQFWKTYISTLVTHVVNTYGTGFLKYLEVWNEPNITTECNPNHNCKEAALARMVEDANTTAKAIDSSIQIISPAVTSKYTSNDCTETGSSAQIAPYLNTLLSQKLTGSTYIIPQYADIIGFHGYIHIPSQGANSASPDPASGAACVASLISSVQSTVSGYTTKQIYDTEGSWSEDCQTVGCTFTPDTWITNPTPPQTASTQERAFTGIYYLIQASNSVCQTSGCNTMAGLSWYGWDFSNTGDFWDQTSQSLTPAGQAYARLHNWLTVHSVTPNQPCSASGSVWTCNFTGTGSYQSEATWDTSQTCDQTGGACSTVSRTAPSWATSYLDLYGVNHTITGGQAPVGLLPILLHN
jgi:hypothetical protein